ncbi:MAG: LEA/WHy family protein [Phycisphaerales bacterium]
MFEHFTLTPTLSLEGRGRLHKDIMRHIILLSLLSLLPACSPLANLTPPEVRLVNIRPGSITVFQTEGQVILKVLNSNAEAITVTGATYEIIIGDAHIGRALSNERLEIPAFSAADQHCTLYISNLMMLNRMRTLLEQPKITYAIHGSMRVTAAEGKTGELSTQSAGELSAELKSPNTNDE